MIRYDGSRAGCQSGLGSRIGSKIYGLALGFLGISLGPAVGSANVSLKNGNFFVGYTDIYYPGGIEPKVGHYYNNKSNYKNGWGNELEVFASIFPDGSVVVHEFGGGAENRFSSPAYNPKLLDKAVEDIVEAARKSGIAGTSAELNNYRQRLKSDALFRNSEWEKFLAQGKLQPIRLANGTQLQSNRFSYQKVVKTPGGLQRIFDTGKVDTFDDLGRLVKVSDKNGNYMELTYGRDGHVQKLQDNFNRKMFFSYHPNGLLAGIDGVNGKKVVYKYNNLGELIYSSDVDGNVYTYKYDSQGRHNLIQIGYSDKTSMEMAYYGMDKRESIKRVKDRDGTVSEYSYEFDPVDKGHTGVSVTVRNSEGKVISNNKYEYFMKVKTGGEEWAYRMVAVVDGDRTETTYNECCGLPLLIKHGADETSFEYDTKGHVIKKETPLDVTRLTYDPKAGKVSKVERFSKVDHKQMGWSMFQYDAKGNLVFAKNSEGKGERLLYDNLGRIHVIIDQNKHQISFKYNENSKPIEITDPAVGTITVSYANSGEIKKVDSSAGRKIAMQVTSTFQNLMEIIRPAGVTLTE